MSKVLVSMIGDESFVAEATPEQMQEIVAQMDEYNKELEKAGVFVSAEGLGPSASAKTLRYGEDGKQVVTDGPFTESKEQTAGFWIFECKDIDEAMEWVRKIPAEGAAGAARSSAGTTIEVRPIPDTPDENAEAYKDAAGS